MLRTLVKDSAVYAVGTIASRLFRIRSLLNLLY
jgi:hypothetical protein